MQVTGSTILHCKMLSDSSETIDVKQNYVLRDCKIIRKQHVIELLLKTGADLIADCRMVGATEEQYLPTSAWDIADSTSTHTPKEQTKTKLL